jgi:hypothetical protein
LRAYIICDELTGDFGTGLEATLVGDSGSLLVNVRAKRTFTEKLLVGGTRSLTCATEDPIRRRG